MRYNPWLGLSKLPPQVWVLVVANLVNRMGTMARAFLVLYLGGKILWGSCFLCARVAAGVLSLPWPAVRPVYNLAT